MRRITISRDLMTQGLPCWVVEGEPEPWDGFTSLRGVVFIKTADGAAWVEFHGDTHNLLPGGVVHEPTTDDRTRVLFNLLPADHARRLTDDETLTIGAVCKPFVAEQRVSAVTMYTHLGGALTPELRMEGVVRSVTMRPIVPGPLEPLNTWLETNDGMVQTS